MSDNTPVATEDSLAVEEGSVARKEEPNRTGQDPSVEAHQLLFWPDTQGQTLGLAPHISASLTLTEVDHMTPETAIARIEIERLRSAVPAEEKTKQAIEETKRAIKQAEEETARAKEETKREIEKAKQQTNRSRHDAVKSAYPLVAAIAGIGAVLVGHAPAWGVALIVGVVAAKPITDKVVEKLKGAGGD